MIETFDLEQNSRDQNRRGIVRDLVYAYLTDPLVDEELLLSQVYYYRPSAPWYDSDEIESKNLLEYTFVTQWLEIRKRLGEGNPKTEIDYSITRLIIEKYNEKVIDRSMFVNLLETFASDSDLKIIRAKIRDSDRRYLNAIIDKYVRCEIDVRALLNLAKDNCFPDDYHKILVWLANTPDTIIPAIPA